MNRNVELETIPDLPSVLIGSILHSVDGSFWYCCGSWKINGMTDVVPCILSYVPDRGRYPLMPDQKTLDINGIHYVKVFGQPLALCRSTYYKDIEGITEHEKLGKVSFLKTKYIDDVKDPHAFVPKYISYIPKDGEVIHDLCRLLEINIEDIGITGSSLMFGQPVKRHELDFGIYGRDKSRRAFQIIEAGRGSGLFPSSSGYHHLPFFYKGVEFDPQFGENEHEANPMEGANINVCGTVRNITFSILKSPDSIFFPAVYETSENVRLVSFRPGQRAYLRPEQTVTFESLSLVNMKWADGTTEKALAVLNDESGMVLK